MADFATAGVSRCIFGSRSVWTTRFNVVALLVDAARQDISSSLSLETMADLRKVDDISFHYFALC
jgi:hypothetical protein